MKKTGWLVLVILVVVILLAAGGAAIALPRLLAATPAPALSPLAVQVTPRPVVAVAGNLLANPSFEGTYVTWGQSVNVAPGWVPWSSSDQNPPCIPETAGCYIPCPQNCIDTHPAERCRTDYSCWWAKAEHKAALLTDLPIGGRVHSGEKAQQAFVAGRMSEFGVYQVVTAPVGAELVFSAYVQAWQCFDWRSTTCKSGLSDLPDKMNLRLGIGTLGETDAYAPTIVWSNPIESFDHYSPLSVTATAQNITITVFTYARPEWGFARKNNDVYWDDASLVMVSPSAAISSIQPPQPELNQKTTIQATSNYSLPRAMLTITNPAGMEIVLAPVSVSGGAPYVWTWNYTPTISGTHRVAFSADTLPAPVVTTFRAIAHVNLTASPAPAWLDQPVNVYVSAYRLYSSSRLTITAPDGSTLTPIYDGATSQGGIFTRKWHWQSVIPGPHRITYTASLIETPVTASVNIVSMASGGAVPPAPPVNTPVTIQMFAYYPYDNAAIQLTDPQGTPLTPQYLGRTGNSPYTWSWTFTPVITGTHTFLITADRLDAPVQGMIFVGGKATYLPVVLREVLR